MSDTPAADIVTDERLVRRLLAEQHPDLPGELRLVSDGWDNQLYRLGDRLAVRVPRREVAAHLIEHEQRMLPAIAARVGVPVPAPVRVGSPSEAFPWPWSVVEWFEGTDGASVDAAGRAGLAEPLAMFVGELAVPAPEAPRNPVRGVPLADRDEAVRLRLRSLSGRREVAHLEQAWREALEAAVWDGPPLLLHGDLHPGNLLIGDSVSLAAVVDFGDVTSGDPATDLATAWLTFDGDAREAFRAALPASPDRATWRRARGWAVAMASALAMSSDDNPRMAALARHTLDQLEE
ncbi:aminoglycoside phosphotransferase family protein [Leifsonia shinshuensis]|uniref:aminoglycoside phosphotransferase family protein n=1 Tax=Leifsonia shinshuensis TaxID=150026 RepID=UPI00285D3980|nr:aminoglycoside phosphotransferase family protein [Leifsonia shinshuensis]MDR6971793.1 aminoglycoside phosphotransferase (APT) family kinase protein [Leifsonia shinshuensis]